METRILGVVVKLAADGKYVASVEDCGGNVLWGPSEPDERGKALKAAQRQREKILQAASKPGSRSRK